MKAGMNWAGGLFCAAVLLAPPSLAEGVADKAAAEALFDEGVRLLEAGDYETACRKLEDSQRVDPGIGTLLYLADCYEKAGRTASAWATFREAASLARNAGQTERAEIGTDRADRLEPHLSRLAIEVAAETKTIGGLKVTRGGQEVSPAVFGAAVPVDPGAQTVTATAPGYLPFEMQVEVAADGASTKVLVPALRVDPDADVQEPPPREEEQADALPPPPPPQKPKGRAQRTAAVVLGSVGLVGVGAGSVFGLMAIDRNDQAFDPGVGNCGPTQCPPGPGNGLINEAYDFATASTIAFIAGGALVAAGVVLYFTAPKGMEAQVTQLEFRPTAGGSAVVLGGRF